MSIDGSEGAIRSTLHYLAGNYKWCGSLNGLRGELYIYPLSVESNGRLTSG